MREAPKLQTPGEAGRRLGLTSGAVKYHDDELEPIVTETGRRLYDADKVDALLARRQARRVP